MFQEKIQPTYLIRLKRNNRVGVGRILNIKEYHEILAVNHISARGYDTDFEYLEALFQDCTYWEERIIGINHFLAIVLEQLEKQEFDTKKSLDWAYSLLNTHKFEIIEGGVDFTDKIFELNVPNSLDLDDQIIESQSNFYYE